LTPHRHCFAFHQRSDEALPRSAAQKLAILGAGSSAIPRANRPLVRKLGHKAASRASAHAVVSDLSSKTEMVIGQRILHSNGLRCCWSRSSANWALRLVAQR